MTGKNVKLKKGRGSRGNSDNKTTIQLGVNVHIHSKLLQHTLVIGTHSSYQLGCLSRTKVSSNPVRGVSEREDGVVALPIGPLKPRYGLEPVLRCEPCTYQSISR